MREVDLADFAAAHASDARLPITPMPVAQCVEQTLEALDAIQPTTITRAQMVAALDGMKANIVHTISQRTGAGRAAH